MTMMTPYRTTGEMANDGEAAERRAFARKVGAGPRWLWIPGKPTPIPKRTYAGLLTAKLALALTLHWWMLAIIIGVKLLLVAYHWSRLEE